MVTLRDLGEEGKRRFVFLFICVMGLSYLMSLTSSSVLVNLPAALFLIITLRYFTLEFEMRQKAAAYSKKPSSVNIYSQNKFSVGTKAVVAKSNWRRKVNSPVVEDAIDHFTRRLISEWVTDLWYSRLTPDKQGPEELVMIINGVLGEISSRMKNINLIELLTRDVIDLLCTHLELFRVTQGKIKKHLLESLTFERRDMELKYVLDAENKLHPVLFSAEAEHKVLQHVMDGLMSFTFKHEDLECSVFRYIVRELLACTVIRPVLNLANPRFINERIEILVSSKGKGSVTEQVSSQAKPSGSSRISSDQFTRVVDPSGKGVELVQLKKDQPTAAVDKSKKEDLNGTLISKDPLLSLDTRSTRSWSSMPLNLQSGGETVIQRHHSGGEWGDLLDVVSRRKTEALAPEHFENMWAKGKNYKNKEGCHQFSETTNDPKQKENGTTADKSDSQSSSRLSKRNGQLTQEKVFPQKNWKTSSKASISSYTDDDDDDSDDVESESNSSYTSEDEEPSSITGLDSPVTIVWDGKNNRNVSVSQIHHPLEFVGRKTRKAGKAHRRMRSHKSQSGRKKSKLSSNKTNIWHEVERTSLLSGDGQDILKGSRGDVKLEESSDEFETGALARVHPGVTASSLSLASVAGTNFKKDSLLTNSFLRLRCEVLGSNIVKSGSRTFAVYSISVVDMNNNSWSIKRRFRHFEELHQRLKEFPEYNLHLPPKHFLSSGLDMTVIQERSILLDQYLKKLLQLPVISESIEVWDFLSVDSQTYTFSNSISIVDTLSVGLDDTPKGRKKEIHSATGPSLDTLSSSREQQIAASKNSSPGKQNLVASGPKSNTSVVLSPQKKNAMGLGKPLEESVADKKSTMGSKGNVVQVPPQSPSDAASDPTLPTEWVPPNLSIPILDLVDVIFQLQDGGWIRRQAFWVAKQVLQLGMGDAFDDWLIEKIQVLRRGTVVASGISRVEQILWPDGIFITKHPNRQRPQSSPSTPVTSPLGRPPTHKKEEYTDQFDEQQQKEAERRAKFVYELMIDHAPAAIVSLVGRKEYERCAKDLYYFIQSSVCLKHLAFDLLELLLLSAFPEMDYVFKQLHEQKGKFGEFKREKNDV